MCHKRRIADKFQKFRQYFLDRPGVEHHTVIDACQLLDLERDRHLRVYKRGKAICDLTVLDLDCPDLYDPVRDRRKACRLDVKDHTCIIQCLPFAVRHDLLQVVDQVALHTVDHFKVIAMIQGMIRIRKCLDAAMIRDRERLVSPLLCALDDILDIGHAVHVAHLRVAVQLHALSDAVVHARYREIRYLYHTDDRTDREFPVKRVVDRDALQFQECTDLQIPRQLRKLLIMYEHLDLDRIREICDLEAYDRPLIADLAGLQRTYLTPDRDFTHLAPDLLDADTLILKIPAINDIGIV